MIWEKRESIENLDVICPNNSIPKAPSSSEKFREIFQKYRLKGPCPSKKARKFKWAEVPTEEERKTLPHILLGLPHQNLMPKQIGHKEVGNITKKPEFQNIQFYKSQITGHVMVGGSTKREYPSSAFLPANQILRVTKPQRVSDGFMDSKTYLQKSEHYGVDAQSMRLAQELEHQNLKERLEHAGEDPQTQTLINQIYEEDLTLAGLDPETFYLTRSLREEEVEIPEDVTASEELAQLLQDQEDQQQSVQRLQERLDFVLAVTMEKEFPLLSESERSGSESE